MIHITVLDTKKNQIYKFSYLLIIEHFAVENIGKVLV